MYFQNNKMIYLFLIILCCGVSSQSICGNGIIENGEQCDNGSSFDPCCVNCLWTRNPCDDNNACTSADTCNGTGICIGDFKCAPSSECLTITCNTTIGNCESTVVSDGTGCGSKPYDFCHKRCMTGICNNSITICPPDNNTNDCLIPVCDSATGRCQYVNITSGSCNDGDSCTTNDTCQLNGTCIGTMIICSDIPGQQCQYTKCSYGSCISVYYDNGKTCNDENECTVGDFCQNGECYPGVNTVCNTTTLCQNSFCNTTTGNCSFTMTQNVTCDDQNVCTTNDTCLNNGTCMGTINPTLADTVQCGHSEGTTNPSSVNCVLGICSLAYDIIPNYVIVMFILINILL